MQFEIKKQQERTAVPLGENLRGARFVQVVAWTWELVKSEQAIAKSAQSFDTEEAARSNIASFRKSVGGVRFAKVVVLDV